ncbi:helix-turn-helix domain-containing protein [Spirosoma gilvum]
MTDIKQKVGQQIREARKAKGMTLREVGDQLGVAEATVSRYELGSQNLTVATLKKIADVLGMEFGVYFK